LRPGGTLAGKNIVSRERARAESFRSETTRMKGNKRARRSQTSSHTAFTDALYGGIKIFDAAEKTTPRSERKLNSFASSDQINETPFAEQAAFHVSVRLSRRGSLFSGELSRLMPFGRPRRDAR